MTVSKKQLEANQKNAQKGGVKTPVGKNIVKYNALKHGLLAKEVVIPVGDGAENPNAFGALLVVYLGTPYGLPGGTFTYFFFLSFVFFFFLGRPTGKGLSLLPIMVSSRLSPDKSSPSRARHGI